jgi:tyrosyl-tRNA synthetase
MLRQEIPCAEVPSEAVISPDRQGRYDVIALFVASGLATSRGDAKRLLEQGGACVDKRRLRPEEQSIALPDLVRTDGHLLLSRGKRDYGLVRLT